MTIEEMKARKTELGYTNEQLSGLSGVPVGTLQKIFSGETKAPRYDTIQKLTKILEKKGGSDMYGYNPDETGMAVGESSAEYGYNCQEQPVKNKAKPNYADHHIPQKKRFGIANGKFKIPPDEMFYDDEITEMFEDI